MFEVVAPGEQFIIGIHIQCRLFAIKEMLWDWPDTSNWEEELQREIKQIKAGLMKQALSEKERV